MNKPKPPDDIWLQKDVITGKYVYVPEAVHDPATDIRYVNADKDEQLIRDLRDTLKHLQTDIGCYGLSQNIQSKENQVVTALIGRADERLGGGK